MQPDSRAHGFVVGRPWRLNNNFLMCLPTNLIVGSTIAIGSRTVSRDGVIFGSVEILLFPSPTNYILISFKFSKMTPNYWMIVERHPRPNGVVGGSILSREFSSILNGKINQVTTRVVCSIK